MVQKMLKEFILVEESVPTWEDAILKAATPLLEHGYITKQYIDKMIQNVHENGPYIVIMPEVALPHARSEYGSIKTGISIMKLHKKVMFPSNKEVSLLVVLSAKDNDTHMQLLSELVDIFMDEIKMKKIFSSSCKTDLLEAL